MTGDYGRFVAAGDVADVAVAVVTFNSAAHLGGLLASLRHEALDSRLRVVVADNGSTDGTLQLLAGHPDVTLVDAGGNRGYAEGINLALRAAGDADASLVLNPDLVVEAGSIRSMLDRLRTPGAGAVVPLISAVDGSTYPSLRREPSLPRAVGDALFGSGAPPWLPSELDGRPASYLRARTVDWATGAAVMLGRETVRAVGDWDPRFFLYSEETDYLRRVRDAGFDVWFEPRALVRHDQGGSGSSAELHALLAVNRVRYIAKYHGRGYAAAYRAVVVLHEALRGYRGVHRSTLRVLLDRSSWDRLPHATRWPDLPDRGVLGAVIIPAHNESAVLRRTLAPLASLAASDRLEVIVVCNGCRDNTAAIAREFRGVRVVETARPSKAAALNRGDRLARFWPRLYLDADVELHPGAIAAVFAELESGAVLAARPAFRYDTTGASAPVRAYYRARTRLPSTSGALWGAGAYALGRRGHERLGEFPELTADDLVVDALFGAHEKRVVETEPVRVRTPRRLDGLLAILRRQRRGNRETTAPSTTRSTLRELAASVRGPLSAVDAAAYAALTLAGRTARSGSAAAWDRDESSRAPVTYIVPATSPAFSTGRCALPESPRQMKINSLDVEK
ncbi:GT2 family glycosyltransferase [Conyzicola lurida]|uniref:GT2 family glycosyltransferase n=1 Tax=Conyzicola lurida TaxID=1172621 RepID=A0A841AUQ0_9MICO|nr:GT2 family glycosyltransferase [Conyzicola lurida]